MSRKTHPEATITPRSRGSCDATECAEDDLLAYVDPDGPEEARTLCPRHRVEYLREVTSQ